MILISILKIYKKIYTDQNQIKPFLRTKNVFNLIEFAGVSLTMTFFLSNFAQQLSKWDWQLQFYKFYILK